MLDNQKLNTVPSIVAGNYLEVNSKWDSGIHMTLETVALLIYHSSSGKLAKQVIEVTTPIIRGRASSNLLVSSKDLNGG